LKGLLVHIGHLLAEVASSLGVRSSVYSISGQINWLNWLIWRYYKTICKLWYCKK